MKPYGAVRNMKPASGTRRVFISSLLFLAAAAAGCYRFSPAGGLPPDLKTIAVVPFDNQTATPEIQRELNDFMRKAFRERLSLRDATEEKADVIVRGTIGKYETDVPIAVSADPRQASVSRRRLLLVIDIEILNQKTGKALFTRKGMDSEGQYAEGQEATGRKLAVETIVDKIIQGTQSQW